MRFDAVLLLLLLLLIVEVGGGVASSAVSDVGVFVHTQKKINKKKINDQHQG